MRTMLPFLVALAITPAMQTPAGTSDVPLTAATFKWEIKQSGELKYLLYLPKECSAQDKSTRWPLMLFLHGAGERGTEVQSVAIHGPMSLVKQGTNFPFIIVAPLCPPDQQWENEPLLQLLDQIEARCPVDTNRVYVTGLSMGGYGTWRLAAAHPERFAAIAPVCGGANLIDLLLNQNTRGKSLLNLPVWAFHGAKDNVVPLDESKRLVAALEKMKAKEVKLTVYPEADHNSWTETYNNPAFYEWLLSHKRGK